MFIEIFKYCIIPKKSAGITKSPSKIPQFPSSLPTSSLSLDFRSRLLLFYPVSIILFILSHHFYRLNLLRMWISQYLSLLHVRFFCLCFFIWFSQNILLCSICGMNIFLLRIFFWLFYIQLRFEPQSWR